MPHKLSLITEQTINDKGWNRYPGNPYNDIGIEKIADNIGNAEIPVTSIPSPFAQMHLFETSFAFINNRFKTDESFIDGKTTYHKYISYCLDIYEMLYNYETLKLKDRISVSTWDRKELAELCKSYNSGVQTFAKTLGIFINNYNNDARFKNLGIEGAFDKFLLIYLDHNIIAGSSPYTGFFTVGNDLPRSIKSNSNDRRYFFSNNEPLYKRSIQFQKYMNTLFASNAQLISAFKEVNSYIKNSNKKNTNLEFKSFIDKLHKNPEDNLGEENLKILEINKQEVSFLNGKIPFYSEKFNQEDEKKSAQKSDYVIQTSKSLKNAPLALLEGYENNRWEYLNGVFPKGCKLIPTEPISKRILPETVMEYPWISRNDFLSKYLVQLEYNINTSKYWLPDGDVRNILLPIKKEYFNYFTVEDLKKQLSIEKLKMGGIEVILEIPIKANNGRGTIRFERTYSEVKPSTIDNDNYGAIVNSSLAFGIYPFFRVSETAFNDKYKILCYHEKGEEISYEFFREIPDEPKIKTIDSTSFSRSRKEENFPAVTNYIDITSVTHSSVGETNLDNNLDLNFEGVCLTIKNNDENIESKCLLIPLMGELKNLVDGNASIAFDIGTSNSFVSIQTSNSIENLSNYNSSGNAVGPHLVMLNEAQNGVDLYKSFDLEGIKPFFGVAQNAEFMPSMVGDDSLFKFPIRSIVNVDNDVNQEAQNSINVLSNTNIPFAFGHNKLRQDLDYVHSNIKWGVTDSSNNAAKNILKGFIEQLVWMGRNKLLSEGINPKAANVIWFKPLSMSAPQKSIFEDIWKDLHNTYFRKETTTRESSKLISITESRAPFYAYESDFGSGRIFMNLDIGGGTTDLIVFSDRKPVLSTSFRFAGNSLFESKSTTDPFDNGFVSKYENIMRNEFGEDFSKIDIINYIKSSKGLMSTDLLSYFFNYKSFNGKLKLDTDFKLLFLIHNSAIFYHAMQILKMSDLEGIPYYVGTSGNGAKLLEITNGGPDLNRYNGLATVLQHITKKVHGLDDLPKMEIQILENPKESTAIGGIKGIIDIKESPHADEKSYYISVGNKSNLVKEQSKEFAYTKFLEQNDKTIEEVTLNVIAFFTYFFDELWYDTNVIKNFGVEASYSSEKLKNYFTDTDKISNTIRDVINHKINIEKETSINETLFFEAIKAYLYAFSKIIVSDKINQFKGAR